MLRNYAPLIVAEQFSMLNALHPNRIDLGIGRARGADPITALALTHTTVDEGAYQFSDQLNELMGFLNGDFPVGHRNEKVMVSPKTAPPPVYLLGSSERGAYAAAARGLPFAFAHHLAPQVTVPALSAYREAFQPSAALASPYVIVTAPVVCEKHRRTQNALRLRRLPCGCVEISRTKGGTHQAPKNSCRHISPNRRQDHPSKL